MAPTGCGQDGEQSRGKRSVRRGRKNQLRDDEPWSSSKRYGSDLTKTIRARGRQGLHREAGHTTVPDPHAALRSKSCLPTRGASTYVASPCVEPANSWACRVPSATVTVPASDCSRLLLRVTSVCPCAVGTKATAAARTTRKAAAVRRKAPRPESRAPPPAMRYRNPEAETPRRGGRRSGGDGGSACSRARGAVMGLGARRSALLIRVAQTTSNHFAQFDTIAAPLPVRAS